jgi:hypothetical protein
MVPVLLVGFVAFPAKLSIFGEAGLCSLVMVNVGSVPLLLFPGNALVVPATGYRMFHLRIMNFLS